MKAFGVFALLSIALVAPAQSLRAQIDAGNKTYDHLMMTKDTKGLKKLMQAHVTSDFKYVENGQTQNFEMMSANMTMGINSMKTLKKAEAKTISVTEKGSTATVLTTRTMEGITMGPDKKPHTLAFGGTSKDTYVKQGGKWKFAKMEWVKQSMTMDGKPFSGR